jgi:ubiquinone/menaquinone biosynthesis C-methylase UbiE
MYFKECMPAWVRNLLMMRGEASPMARARLSRCLCPLVTSIGVGSLLGKGLLCGFCAADGFGITVFNGAGILSVFSPDASTVLGVVRRDRRRDQVSQSTPTTDTKPGTTSHNIFARTYELFNGSLAESNFMVPLRREIVGKAGGLVLEVGAGTGLNFSFYQPGQVERVEAIEPDAAMLRYARERLNTARVPITLTQVAVEALPFANETFDSAVTTLVFCSVTDPVRGFREIMRVLKPGGTLLLVEHVRSQGAIAGLVQDALVPVTKLLAGNCHWNRDTAHTVAEVGFQVTFKRDIHSLLMPMVLLEARRS